MNIPLIFDFLKDLSANNNRTWFQDHRAEYDAAQAEFDAFVDQAISTLAVFDESIRGIQVKDCTYRIYRDIRFSPDKTPYKDHFGAYINAKGKKSQHCGYYIHMQPGNCLLAGGSWCPPPKLLKALRDAVYDDIDEYRAIVEDPAFRRYFPTIGMTHLKTAPLGFPKDFPYLEYLRPKEYTVEYGVPDSFFTSPQVFEDIADVCRQMKRFADFVNLTIDEYEDRYPTY